MRALTVAGLEHIPAQVTLPIACGENPEGCTVRDRAGRELPVAPANPWVDGSGCNPRGDPINLHSDHDEYRKPT
jgi:hypothetical protein